MILLIIHYTISYTISSYIIIIISSSYIIIISSSYIIIILYHHTLYHHHYIIWSALYSDLGPLSCIHSWCPRSWCPWILCWCSASGKKLGSSSAAASSRRPYRPRIRPAFGTFCRRCWTRNLRRRRWALAWSWGCWALARPWPGWISSGSASFLSIRLDQICFWSIPSSFGCLRSSPLFPESYLYFTCTVRFSAF